MKKLLIIYYHEIVPDGQGNSYQKLDISKFEEQMKYLHEFGYHTLKFSELVKSFPDKSVVVSFDDGFRSVYENAVPIMEKYGIHGNVYLPTAYIETEQKFMTWTMIEELYKTGNWYFAAHTHNHVDIRKLDDEEAKKEIGMSHMLFESHLGYIPTAFCCPFGTFDSSSIRQIRKTGKYSYMLGSYYGHISAEKLGKKVLPRIGISNDDSIDIFEKKLTGKLDWKGLLQRIRLAVSNMRGQKIDHYDY